MAENSAEGSASSDETKRKFREALDRKNGKARANADHKDGGAKPANAHGKAGSHREFRRKSG